MVHRHHSLFDEYQRGKIVQAAQAVLMAHANNTNLDPFEDELDRLVGNALQRWGNDLNSTHAQAALIIAIAEGYVPTPFGPR